MASGGLPARLAILLSPGIILQPTQIQSNLKEITEILMEEEII
jgi:hypothetical protein